MHKGELRLEEVSAKAIDGFDLSRDRTCNLEFIRTAGHPPSYFSLRVPLHPSTSK